MPCGMEGRSRERERARENSRVCCEGLASGKQHLEEEKWCTANAKNRSKV
jgi:hypothetical protein